MVTMVFCIPCITSSSCPLLTTSNLAAWTKFTTCTLRLRRKQSFKSGQHERLFAAEAFKLPSTQNSAKTPEPELFQLDISS